MTDAEQLYSDIQKALAGHTEKAVLTALISNLIVAIGVSSNDLHHAEQVVKKLPDEMLPMIRKGWADFRVHRARTGGSSLILPN